MRNTAMVVKEMHREKQKIKTAGGIMIFGNVFTSMGRSKEHRALLTLLGYIQAPRKLCVFLHSRQQNTGLRRLRVTFPAAINLGVAIADPREKDEADFARPHFPGAAPSAGKPLLQLFVTEQKGEQAPDVREQHPHGGAAGSQADPPPPTPNPPPGAGAEGWG